MRISSLILTRLSLNEGARHMSVQPTKCRLRVLLWSLLLALGIARAEARPLTLLHGFSVPPSAPRAEVIEGSDGVLYGTTVSGGADDHGTIFRVNRDGSGFLVLHDFTANDTTNPTSPLARLLEGSDG